MNPLLSLDEKLFLWINKGWSSDFLDLVAPWLREAEHWIPLYVVIAIFFLVKWRWAGLIGLLLLTLNFATTDIVSSRVIKKSVERPRPCHDQNEDLLPIVRVRCGSGYSFTSSHATNHFGFAAMLFFLMPFGKRWLFSFGLLWAAAISLSQVYVGVHFPLDIAAGGLLGILIARFWYWMYCRFVPMRFQFMSRA